MKFNEIDLYDPVKKFFVSKGYIVNGEVKNCDVVAVKEKELIIVELKLKFNLNLVYQALERQKITDDVFVAIPRLKNFKKYKNIIKLLKSLNLGLIVVAMESPLKTVEIIIYPSKNNIRKLHKEKILKEINGRSLDINKGGSKGKKLNTAFREKSIKIACALEKEEVYSAKELIKFYNCEKDTTSILCKNFYGWFEKVSRGKYTLSAQGKEALNDSRFKEVIDYYKTIYKKE